jgi:thioredoxin-like negative regulator of GroEL
MNKLLVFSASWCGPCQALKPTIDKLDQDRIVKYDIDESTEEKEAYNIRAIPAMILVDENGEEIQRLVGSQSLSDIQSLLDV